ncbi:MAG TPA: helix-turn-helix transcriptional regulator [Chitinophagaceae bacterium]|nr:helix-turn-helix transcriptional regulator [Chitinophagaceae bacterium]
MDVETNFVAIAGIIGEPARAKMLWSLLDGKAYTATELAITADLSPTAVSNHLSKLLRAGVVQVDAQGRHRYYSFANPEAAYAVEALAQFVNLKNPAVKKEEAKLNGVKYCRTCYDHLAGYIGVRIAEALVKNSYLKKTKTGFEVTANGWSWFADFNIHKGDFRNSRRPVARQCLDWSERRPHLAGQLGAVFLERMFQRKWFRKVQFSRELIITAKGNQELFSLLSITT